MGIQILKNILKSENFERKEKLTNIKIQTTLNIQIGSPPQRDPNFVEKKSGAIFKIELVLSDESDNTEKIKYNAEYVIEYKTEENLKVEEFNKEIFDIISNDIFNRIEDTFHKAGLKDYRINRFKLEEASK